MSVLPNQNLWLAQIIKSSTVPTLDMKYETIATWCFIIGGNTFVEDATDIFSDDYTIKKN